MRTIEQDTEDLGQEYEIDGFLVAYSHDEATWTVYDPKGQPTSTGVDFEDACSEADALSEQAEEHLGELQDAVSDLACYCEDQELLGKIMAMLKVEAKARETEE